MTIRITLVAALVGSLFACKRTVDPVETDTDTDTDTDADTDSDTDTDADPCGVPATVGPFSGHPIETATTTATPYTNDANLSAVWAADPGEGNTADLTATPIQITGAIMMAKSFHTDPNIWIGDSSGRVYIGGLDVAGLGTLNPGDAVDLSVTGVSNYFGRIRITSIAAAPTVTSTGNAVYVGDATAIPTFDWNDTAQRGMNHEFYGFVPQDSGDDCGNNTCWEVTTGGVTHTIQINDSFSVNPGQDCLHFIAPVDWIRGEPRFASDEFDWIEYY